MFAKRELGQHDVLFAPSRRLRERERNATKIIQYCTSLPPLSLSLLLPHTHTHTLSRRDSRDESLGSHEPASFHSVDKSRVISLVSSDGCFKRCCFICQVHDPDGCSSGALSSRTPAHEVRSSPPPEGCATLEK